MLMNKHILFYSDKCIHCIKLLKIIENNKDNFKFIDVDNKNTKIPAIIEKVPTLIVKGMNKPLIGKEVFSWINAQQFLNLETNNINNVKNPIFSVDINQNPNTKDINYISINDNDDDLNKTIVNFNKINEIFITEDINKIIKDFKINKDLQNQKLDQLLNNRTNQIDSILNFNKKL